MSDKTLTDNSQKQREQQVYKVTITGSIVSLLLILVKFPAGIMGRSAAMVADAVHSLSALLTDVISSAQNSFLFSLLGVYAMKVDQENLPSYQTLNYLLMFPISPKPTPLQFFPYATTLLAYFNLYSECANKQFIVNQIKGKFYIIASADYYINLLKQLITQ